MENIQNHDLAKQNELYSFLLSHIKQTLTLKLISNTICMNPQHKQPDNYTHDVHMK